jgi:3-oxoacyl-[acyl-carrier-protein] synthase III
MGAADPDSVRIREIVERCLRGVLPAGTLLPGEDEDWIESDLLDSMGHVEVLLAIESAVNLPNLFAQVSATPPVTIRAATEAVQKALSLQSEGDMEKRGTSSSLGRSTDGLGRLIGWGMALGSERVTSNKIEEEFNLSVGTLSTRAGIDSVSRASGDENEILLAKVAAERALKMAGVSAQSANWIIGTSETFLGFPSFAVSIHTTLLASSTCQVLDIGGACVGLLNSLAVANALFGDPRIGCILIVSADVHSRLLAPGKVRGEFGGLFGDGASAFVLRRSMGERDSAPCSIRVSIGGCSGTFSSALQVRPGAAGAVAVDFEGEALARAAVDRMERIISDLETATGVMREHASAFALHQPNPRLVETLIRRAKLPSEKVPLVAKTWGNLGSSTCGVALNMAMDDHAKKPRGERGPIFAASVGPGMLWAGAILD